MWCCRIVLRIGIYEIAYNQKRERGGSEVMGWLSRTRKKMPENGFDKEKKVINNAGHTDTLHIHQVSDYLKLIGMRITVFMLNKESIPWVTVCGNVRDLSDNGQNLVLTDVEILWRGDRFSHQEICQIDLKDFDMVRIEDRYPGE